MVSSADTPEFTYSVSPRAQKLDHQRAGGHVVAGVGLEAAAAAADNDDDDDASAGAVTFVALPPRCSHRRDTR